MALMSLNAESPRRHFGDILKLTNSILAAAATYYTITEISDFVPGLINIYIYH